MKLMATHKMHSGEHQVILEPRTRSRKLDAILILALMILNIIGVYNIFGFNNAADKTNQSSEEARCRSETSSQAIAIILGQQTLITTGLSEVVTGTEEFDPAAFASQAARLAAAAVEVIDLLETNVERCQSIASDD